MPFQNIKLHKDLFLLMLKKCSYQVHHQTMSIDISNVLLKMTNINWNQELNQVLKRNAMSDFLPLRLSRKDKKWNWQLNYYVLSFSVGAGGSLP
jgi:hypothetical protein